MALDVGLTPELSLVFTTPLYMRRVQDCEALNAGLARLILAWRGQTQGTALSNVGGWQSPHSLLSRAEPEIARLRTLVDEAVRAMTGLPALVEQRPSPATPRYTAGGWANVNTDGDYNQLHVHPRSHWAVVYYVATGTPAPGVPFNGKIELRDPRPGAQFGRVAGFTFGRPLTVEPQPGLVLSFPSWVEHWVHPFRGTGERISIAINVEMAETA
jgi:uncharacterized protein (TIGR02466 family)